MRTECAIATAALAACGTAASATIIDNIIYNIEASSSLGTASFTAEAVDDDGDGFYTWSMESMDLMDDESLIATLDSGDTSVNGPMSPANVNLNFAVSAGAADTTFSISSAILTFADIDPAFAGATAGITLTDAGGGGANLAGGFGGDAYRATLNGDALAGTGTEFDTLVAGFGTLSTQTNGESSPGTFPLLTSVEPIALTQISSAFSFTLTAGDSASGTSTFRVDDVVPTPGTVGLLGLAGLAAARRRR